MTRPRFAFALAVALLLTACAAPPRDDAAARQPATVETAPATRPAAAVATLPTPYTAEAIRAANPPGTRLRMRVETYGRPAVLRETAFIAGDETRATMEGRLLAATGEAIAPVTTSTATWTELRDHAAFPAAAASRERTTVDVAAGSFEAWRYDVRGDEAGAGTTTSYWFADDRPGPPVLVEQRDATGRILMRMEMVDGGA